MDIKDGNARSISNSSPAHYIVKIQSFSLLTKNSIERYESGEFEAGGYKWKLVLYPNGNKKKNVKDYVSLYLALDEASSLQPDAIGKEIRFHKLKVEWGFDQFISLKEFNDGSKGYMVDDICAFGAEVFVCKERSTGKGEFLVMVKDTTTYKHVWEVTNFSNLDSECSESKPFNAGNYKWKIKLYPKGKDVGLESYLSLHLALADPTNLSQGSKIYAQIVLRILDQKQAKHHFGKANYWFSTSSFENGAAKFILLSNFTSQNLGYLVKDNCTVEAEVTILGMVGALS